MKYRVNSVGFESMKKRAFVVDEELAIVAIAYGASDYEADKIAEKIAEAMNESK